MSSFQALDTGPMRQQLSRTKTRTMFALYTIPHTIIVDFVNAANTDPDIPDGQESLVVGGERASGSLECNWLGAGFLEDKQHLKARVLAGVLIAIILLIPVLVIIIMRWGRCSKSKRAHDHHHDHHPPGLKQESKELKSVKPKQCQEFQQLDSATTTNDDKTGWTISIPYDPTSSCRPEEFEVLSLIPTLSTESLNPFPSSLTIGVYTGFTTGVGPRR